MTSTYEKVVESVKLNEDEEFLNFHSRKHVEMAGNIIIGHLLLFGYQIDVKFNNTAELFIKSGMASNEQKINILNSQ